MLLPIVTGSQHKEEVRHLETQPPTKRAVRAANTTQRLKRTLHPECDGTSMGVRLTRLLPTGGPSKGKAGHPYETDNEREEHRGGSPEEMTNAAQRVECNKLAQGKEQKA